MSTSAEALTWAWRQAPSKPLAKYVLVALAGETTRVQGGPYMADPGVAKLVKLTGLDESAVRRNLLVLVKDKIVTKERTHDGKGHRGEDRYMLPVAVVASIPNGSRAHQAQSPVGSKPSGSRAQSQTGTGPAAESPVGSKPTGRRARTSTKNQEQEQEQEHAAAPRKRARNDLFDAIATACGWDLTAITKSAGAECGKAAAEIKAAGGTAAMVTLYAQRYRRQFGADIQLTPSALTKWWAKLASASTGTEGATDTRPEWAR